ncbi:MAG: hypothetical protein AAFX52_00985 [Pseudomonadota bacterium]
MHILGLLVLVMGAISVWWWRLKAAKEAADTVIDAAERFSGKRRRAKIADATAFSPITAIDDPVAAAATYIHFVVGKDVWPSAHGRVRARLADVSDPDTAENAVIYAEWASRQPLDYDRAIQMLAETLRGQLTLEERQDLASMLEDAAQSGDQEVQARASREAIRLIN